MLENETHKLFLDFEIQTDHLLLDRRPDLVVITKKENLPNWGLCCPSSLQSKIEKKEKKYKYLELARELKKTVEHDNEGVTNCNWCSWFSHQRIGTGTGGLGNKKTSGEHPNYCIAEISQSTEKSFGDLRGLAVTQVPVKNYQLTLVQKPQEGIIIIIIIIITQQNSRIDKTQQNSKDRLCGDRDETINHIISECSKLAQKKYKTRHEWVGKVIQWEMCKKFKFDHTNK